jgi:hypothetical protein
MQIQFFTPGAFNHRAINGKKPVSFGRRATGSEYQQIKETFPGIPIKRNTCLLAVGNLH